MLIRTVSVFVMRWPDTSTVRAVRDGVGVILDILRIRRAARRGHYPSLGDHPLPTGADAPTDEQRTDR